MKLAISVCALTLMPALASAQVQNEIFKYSATGATPMSEFGTCVAVYGSRAVVGAPVSSDFAVASGAAFLIDLSTGQQIAKLLESSPGYNHQFGRDVAIHDNILLVATALGGGAYLFDAITGQEIAALVPSVQAASFGFSVDLSTNHAIVGTTNNAGLAFVFDLVTHQEVAVLHPTIGTFGSGFGTSVAINDTVALVGAPHEDDFGFSSGAAYLFQISTGQQIAQLLANDGAGGDYFGESVDLNSRTAIVGSRLNDQLAGNSGAAYLFDVESALQTNKLVGPVASLNGYFGNDVAINDTAALVGAPFQDLNGFNSGAAYLFDLSNAQLIGNFRASDGDAGDVLGTAVALSNEVALVGAPWDEAPQERDGSVYQFPVGGQLTGTGFCYGDGSGTPCPCLANGTPGGGCDNSNPGTGGAKLVGQGMASISNDSFSLHVTGAPAGTPGLILRGANQINGGAGSTIGDGLLCTTFVTARSQVQMTGNGTATFSDFLGAPFGASSYGPGIPTYYQFWYRDTQGTCSAAGFNFSNAWDVTWQM